MVEQNVYNKYMVTRTQDVNDREVILRCRKGDIEAFGELVEKYQRSLYTVVYRLVRDSSDADDITQTAFIKAYENLSRYKTEYPFFSWIHRIAVNEALNILRKRRRNTALTDTYETTEDDPETDYVRNELQQQVDRALERLTPESQVIIVLRHFGELSYAEIGEILDIPEKTVKSRLFSARQSLRSYLS
jgi:RNA polymerase sigma-70 factor, ECF subfamily